LQSQNSSYTTKLNETSSRVEAMERAEREKQQAEPAQRLRRVASRGRWSSDREAERQRVHCYSVRYLLRANQTALQLRAKSKMDSLANLISSHRDVVFTIEGHTDARPNADGFALGRAQSVADYLVALGVPRSSFRVESRGDTVPISTGRTLAARAMNRRVELVFIGPQ